ncbi:uncharacterized protein BX663DRAFT_531603 [Cokeromyces recurvatus]|uniref:uncharacterized protein n=1 Tax=Cokeromyces recurvatus TaxID=90255 RepID=UPI00221E382E|nr:uncharacterized protein BX663DRAFT_531603 [Cokeromyces recurvatus]KAI7901854.1 hypothetical protein BX663DRAFT_531603 [Cokeromyces recurvatus]
MLLLKSRQIIPRLGITCQLLKYSTLPKKASGPFTSNKLISQSVNESSDEIRKTLVYIGPFAETMKRYKMTASFFGLCGIISVPALLSSGQVPVLSAAIETISFWGRFKEETMWLSQLHYKPTSKGLVWQQKTGAKHTFTLEREIMDADPYLKALADRVQRKEV